MTHGRIRSASPQPRSVLVLAVLTLLMAVILASAVSAIPDEPRRLAGKFRNPAFAERVLAASGVGNPVTAVLLSVRAYDTMLELCVLVLALLGAQAALSTSSPVSKKTATLHNPLLTAAVGIIVPVSIVVAGNLLWMGKDSPGGAFQAGAVLGGACIMLIVAGRTGRFTTRSSSARLAAIAGVTVFLLIGAGGLPVGRPFLQYPSGASALCILLIEAATTVSVAVIFVLLFSAVAGPVELDESNVRGEQ